jgi:hypothetical protein
MRLRHSVRAPPAPDLMLLCSLLLPCAHVCPPQDFLTCAFLLSSKDRFFSRSQFGQLAAAMGDGLDEVRGRGCMQPQGCFCSLGCAVAGVRAWIRCA